MDFGGLVPSKMTSEVSTALSHCQTMYRWDEDCMRNVRDSRVEDGASSNKVYVFGTKAAKLERIAGRTLQCTIMCLQVNSVPSSQCQEYTAYDRVFTRFVNISTDR